MKCLSIWVYCNNLILTSGLHDPCNERNKTSSAKWCGATAREKVGHMCLESKSYRLLTTSSLILANFLLGKKKLKVDHIKPHEGSRLRSTQHSVDVLFNPTTVFVKAVKTRVSQPVYRIAPFGTLWRENCFFLVIIDISVRNIVAWHMTNQTRKYRGQLTPLRLCCYLVVIASLHHGGPGDATQS